MFPMIYPITTLLLAKEEEKNPHLQQRTWKLACFKKHGVQTLKHQRAPSSLFAYFRSIRPTYNRVCCAWKVMKRLPVWLTHTHILTKKPHTITQPDKHEHVQTTDEKQKDSRRKDKYCLLSVEIPVAVNSGGRVSST